MADSFGEVIHGLKMSEQINELATAMSKCQSKVGIAHKNKNNPFYSSTYADLEAVIDAYREPMAENGLSIIQFPSFKDGWVYLTTIVMHQSGQFLRATMGARPVLNFDKKSNKYEEFPSPQSLGSCIKYLRRYTQESVFNVPTSDDDGNHASGKQHVDRNDHKPAQRTEVKPAKERSHWNDLMYQLKKAGVPFTEAGELEERKLGSAVVYYCTNKKLTLDKCYKNDELTKEAVEAVASGNREFPADSDNSLMSQVKEKLAEKAAAS